MMLVFNCAAKWTRPIRLNWHNPEASRANPTWPNFGPNPNDLTQTSGLFSRTLDWPQIVIYFRLWPDLRGLDIFYEKLLFVFQIEKIALFVSFEIQKIVFYSIEINPSDPTLLNWIQKLGRTKAFKLIMFICLFTF